MMRCMVPGPRALAECHRSAMSPVMEHGVVVAELTYSASTTPLVLLTEISARSNTSAMNIVRSRSGGEREVTVLQCPTDRAGMPRSARGPTTALTAAWLTSHHGARLDPQAASLPLVMDSKGWTCFVSEAAEAPSPMGTLAPSPRRSTVRKLARGEEGVASRRPTSPRSRVSRAPDLEGGVGREGLVALERADRAAASCVRLRWRDWFDRQRSMERK